MHHATLKQRHRAIRDSQPDNLRLRIHRALSWLQRAEQTDDIDGRFIFLWISFNAAYAQEINSEFRLSEQETFKSFLEKLCNLDGDKRIDDLVWKTFSTSIRILLDNPYVFESFWEFQRGNLTESAWQERFERGKQTAHRALANGNTPTLLGVVFNRIYTLRNQIIHGGATWNGSVNREQLRDCTSLLEKLIPLVIQIMMDHPQAAWGDACYPVIE